MRPATGCLYEGHRAWELDRIDQALGQTFSRVDRHELTDLTVFQAVR